MDKRRAIRILINAAALYRDNLEGQKVLFLYGSPKVIKRQLLMPEQKLVSMKSYEVAFYRRNFLHLTGIRPNSKFISSAIHFYEKCLDKRLTENDFFFSKDGSTGQKLNILENMMKVKVTATMIGDFTDHGLKLYAEKAAGNTGACLGFVRDRNTGLNVPNTLLEKDIRNVTDPVQKVFAVLSKGYREEKYSRIEKVDKSICLEKCSFSDEIESFLCRARSPCYNGERPLRKNICGNDRRKAEEPWKN